MLWVPPYSLALKISVHSTEFQWLPRAFLLFLFCLKVSSGFQSPFCHLPADWRYWGINSPTSSPQPMADGSWGTYISFPLCLGWAVPKRVIWADSQSSPVPTVVTALLTHPLLAASPSLSHLVLTPLWVIPGITS